MLQRHPPRPVPASWALTSQPKPQVIARLLAPPFPAGRANLDQERRRGVIHVLEWLEAQPGDTWQDRWITSGADAAGNPPWRGLLAGWLAGSGRGPRDPEHVSLLAGRAIMLLVCADVIRPDPALRQPGQQPHLPQQPGPVQADPPQLLSGAQQRSLVTGSRDGTTLT